MKKIDKLKRISNKAKEDLDIILQYSGFSSLEDYLNHIHTIEKLDSFHKMDDVLSQLMYYIKIQRSILHELEGK